MMHNMNMNQSIALAPTSKQLNKGQKYREKEENREETRKGVLGKNRMTGGANR